MTADLIITGADARPMTHPGARAGAVAVKDGRIALVGTDAAALALRGPGTSVIEAKGALLLPGFVESHMHLFPGAASLRALDLTEARGDDALRDAILRFDAARPGGDLLIGRGVQYTVLDDLKRLDRRYLDAILPDRPMILVSCDYHNAWANTVALERAGVLNGADLPPGSQVEMGADGRATGVLIEPPAAATVQRLSPTGGREMAGLDGVEPPETTAAERDADKAMLREGLAYCAAHGITTVINMDGNRYQADLLRQIEAAGDLICRVELPFHYTPAHRPADIERAEEMRAMLGSDRLWCERVKFFMDGVIDMETAVRLSDYPGRPGFRGEPLHAPDTFAALCAEVDGRGFQIATHAIGDGAVRATLDGYEAAFRANGPRDARHRVEHIELIDPADIPRFRELGAIASVQPPHPPGCGGFPLEPTRTIIGRAEWPNAYLWRTLADAGANLCFASDWPVSELPPLDGIRNALNRTPWTDDLPDERIGPEATLAAYTIGGAYAARRETAFGSLAPGMAADLALIDGVDGDDFSDARVAMTICAGDVTFAA